MDNSKEAAKAPAGRRIKLFGVGKAGCRIVDLVAAGASASIECHALDCDQQSLQGLSKAQPLQLGSEMVRGMGTGGDPELGRAAADSDRSAWEAAMQEASLVVLVGGLGGGTASGALPLMARQGRKGGALVLALATLPMDFQGNQARSRAQTALNQLTAASHAVLPVSLQSFAGKEGTGIGELFERIDEQLVQAVRGILNMMDLDGLLPVDFQEIRSVVGGKRSSNLLATSRAEGEDRAGEAVRNLLASPLLKDCSPLSETDVLLFHVRGGRNLTTGEVERIGARLQELSPQARLVAGASTDASLKDRVELSLIARWPRTGQPAVLEIQAPQGEVVEFALAIKGLEDQQVLPLDGLAETSSRHVAPLPMAKAREVPRQIPGSDIPKRLPEQRRMVQGTLDMPVPPGRFDRCVPSVYDGQDLDVPTFVRKGLSLN